jgi:DegV family protein with EDD domain
MTTSWVNNVRIFISVSTMKYLVKGGRVSRMKGLLARLLNVNPVIAIDESGKAVVYDKAFNQKASMETVLKHVLKSIRGSKVWNYIVLHSNSPEYAGWYSEKMYENTGLKPLSVIDISPVLGAHVGVGAAAIAVLPE